MKVRLYSHIGRRSGYGKAGCELAMSLLAAGIDLEIRPIDTIPESEAGIALAEHHVPLAARVRRDDQFDPKPDAIVVHTLPMDCWRLLDMVNLHRIATKFVAYTTWEALSPAPAEMVAQLAGFDQVWVPSLKNAETFGELDKNLTFPDAPRKVRVVPHAFWEDSLEERRAAQSSTPFAGELANPRGGRPFRFYYTGAWNSRKNPAALVRAFVRTFTKSDEVELALHLPGVPSEAFLAALASTAVPMDEMPKIVHSTKLLPEYAMTGLHREMDCFVTATRGEAWNLPAFDAMLAGRKVIAPGGMGSDDYLRDTGADLYGGMASLAVNDVKVEPKLPGTSGPAVCKPIGAQGLTCRATWLEPDLVRLCEHMKNVYEFRRRTMEVRYDPAGRYGYKAVGQICKTHLEAL